MEKWKRDGTFAGWIYPVASGTWGMTWDGEHLWTIQNTCERWNDPNIFEIKIIDDTRPLPE